MLGKAVTRVLEGDGHEVIRLKRNVHDADRTITLWDPESAMIIHRENMEGLDAVIHLAGENIAARRWNPERKMKIRNSRVQGTACIANALSELKRKPKVFLTASAVGFYGECGEDWVDEKSPRGKGFLSHVCRDWEDACISSENAGIRVVKMRMGLVLSPEGGALQKMLTPFRLGLGGVVGKGSQYWSWISVQDCARAMLFLLKQEGISGPVNMVSPNPVTNAEFTRSLARALRRPAFVPMIAPLARLIMGEAADELLLCSTRVRPGVLADAGFAFEFPEIDGALKQAVKQA